MTSNIIKFIHSNRIIEICNPDPNETLLNYVRTRLRKTGTKEGCAEGGCGACTIVLGELKNNNINYKAINSCITFLPTQICMFQYLDWQEASYRSLPLFWKLHPWKYH